MPSLYKQAPPFCMQVELVAIVRWYAIPGFSKHMISNDGVVVYRPTRRVCKVRADGLVRIRSDEGGSRRLRLDSIKLLAGLVEPPIGSKPVPGFPGLYATLEGTLWNSATGKHLDQPKQTDFYKTTTIHGRSYRIHVLVCTAFHGLPPEDKTQVGHRDGDNQNNKPDNIRWVNQSENEQDKKLHNRFNHDTNSWRVKSCQS